MMLVAYGWIFLVTFIGGVGGWVVEKIEENEAVRMRCWT